MRIFNKMVFSYLIVWALAYIFTAIFAPGISGDVLFGTIVYLLIGIALLLSLWLVGMPITGLNHTSHRIGQVMLLILGAISIYAAITSWSGVAIWNVPFVNKELFQVSMAAGNLIAAVLMFYIGILSFDQL
jgi:hypothetical protein